MSGTREEEKAKQACSLDVLQQTNKIYLTISESKPHYHTSSSRDLFSSRNLLIFRLRAER